MRMEEKKNERPPVQRIGGGEMDKLFGFSAVVSEFTYMWENKYFTERLKSIKNGYRNVRLAETLLSGVLEQLCLTLPPEKVAGIRDRLKRMKFVPKVGAYADKHDTTREGVRSDWLDHMLYVTWESDCVFNCESDKCTHACPTCAMLDYYHSYDRNGAKWSTIDAARMKERK